VEPAWVWDISPTGACLLLEGCHRHAPGEILTIELRNEAGPVRMRVPALVRHADICCPNFTEARLHGCAFLQQIHAEELVALT
jgi:hypothetical protein